MKTVYSVDDLDKPIDEYEIKSNPSLKSFEKEIHTIITRGEDGKDIALFSSDKRAGITWAIAHVLQDNAKVDYIHIDGDAIVGIGVRLPLFLLAYKSKPRKSNTVASCFSSP